MSENGFVTVAPGSVEVVATAHRRRFSAEYKRRIVAEADCASYGEIGLLLRREGLYSSQLAQWRKGRSGMTRKTPSKQTVARAEFERVVKENAKLKLKLRKAEAMLSLQKKAAEVLRELDESDGGAS